MSQTRPLRLGTRGSQLALWQARETERLLLAAHPELAERGIEIVEVKTTGDRVRDRPLAELGGKGLFAKEIEQALTDGAIDVAVHSLKDLPTELPEGLVLSAMLPREDHRDMLIAKDGAPGIAALPAGARVGTCSLRRQAQLLLVRPDLDIHPLRGNVDTRLGKVADGVFDATLLAAAGLRRLGLEKTHSPLPEEEMLPAVAQGTIALEIRAEDEETQRLTAAINDTAAWQRASAERACLAGLRGSCHTPIGVLARLRADTLTLEALFLLPDGSQPLRQEGSCAPEEGARMGLGLGEALRRDSSADHLALLEP